MAAGNVQLAAQLVEGLRRAATPPGSLVFANSVQAGNGTPYGDSKATAASLLADTGLPFDDVLLPNLYGEHGRPYYNSAVATFCRVLAEGGQPEVHADRQLDLVHVTDAAARLAGVPAGGSWDPAMPPLRVGVRDLAGRLAAMADTYRTGRSRRCGTGTRCGCSTPTGRTASPRTTRSRCPGGPTRAANWSRP